MNSKIISTLLKMVFPITFNVVFLVTVLSADMHAAAWISCFFVDLSYIVMIMLPYFKPKEKNTEAANYVVYLTTSLGFVVIFIVGFLIMFINPESFGVQTFLIMLVLLMIEAAATLTYMLANKNAADMIAQQSLDSCNMRTIAFDLQSVSTLFTDPEQKKKLNQLADIIRTSPTASRPEVYEYEQEIRNTVADIVNQIKAGKQADYNSMFESIRTALTNRNNKLKLL